MRVLEITVDLGPGVSPSLLETMVTAVRVAVDVGTEAMRRQVRRSVTEQMKFPTDQELADALEQLPGGDELSPQYRARRLLEVREELAEESDNIPPDMWWYYWSRQRGGLGRLQSRLAAAGFERAFAGSPFPWSGGTIGLDVIDPELYHALVAWQVATLSPSAATVRSLRYENPIAETITAVGTGAEALNKTAGAIETIATLSALRKIKNVEARVAEATADDDIESSRLTVAMQREQLRQMQLNSALMEQDLLAKEIANEQALRALTSERKRDALAEQFRRTGHLDEADVVARLEPADADALLELGLRDPKVRSMDEPDPDL